MSTTRFPFTSFDTIIRLQVNHQIQKNFVFLLSSVTTWYYTVNYFICIFFNLNIYFIDFPPLNASNYSISSIPHSKISPNSHYSTIITHETRNPFTFHIQSSSPSGLNPKIMKFKELVIRLSWDSRFIPKRRRGFTSFPNYLTKFKVQSNRSPGYNKLSLALWPTLMLCSALLPPPKHKYRTAVFSCVIIRKYKFTQPPPGHISNSQTEEARDIFNHEA